ncbi:hypothetical protein IBT54_004209 [Pantoea sp. S62]|nr:hypothetical protein [Pantoea sp. S62]
MAIVCGVYLQYKVCFRLNAEAGKHGLWLLTSQDQTINPSIALLAK